LAHQINHGEQKRITCNYSNHKLSGNITELTRQRCELKHLCAKKLIHKPNSGLDLVVRKPKIQKVKEKKKKIIIKVENIGLLKSSIDISCISHFYRFTVMDASFHASENDFIWEDCGKCLKSRSGLRRHRLRQHLKQEMKKYMYWF
jgi:hypothetical protein